MDNQRQEDRKAKVVMMERKLMKSHGTYNDERHAYDELKYSCNNILVDPDYNQGRWTGQGENKVYVCYIYVEIESETKKNKIEMHCEVIISEVSKNKIVVEELV